MCVVYFVPSSSLSVLIYVCRCLPISFFGFILLPTTEVTHTSNFTASTQHHPPTRSLSGGHTADNFMHSQTLPSQKLFLGEVSYNLPPHSAANSRCAVDVYFDAEQKGKKSIKKKERKMVLWLDFVVCMCYVCSLFVHPSLCLSWFCQTLRSPTQVPPHSTILPLAHLEVVTADSLPTSMVVTVEASPIRSVYGGWHHRGKLHHAPTHSLEGRTANSFIQLSFPESPSQPEAVSWWGQRQPAPTFAMRCWRLFWCRAKKSKKK